MCGFPKLVSTAALMVGFSVWMSPPVMAQVRCALSGGGVWDIPGGRRGAFNPANPVAGVIGNMGLAGVVYNIGAAPGGAQAGAAAQATAAFNAWNALGGGAVRINLVAGAAAGANAPLSWAATVPAGETTNAAINFNPRLVRLHDTRTLRTDRWSLDFAGTRPRLADEYDIFTVAVHEVGHVIGLGHPATNVEVMTDNVTARQNAGSSWRAVERTTPFNGQPMDLTGGALPNGARAYPDPRAALSANDTMCARTLYTAPRGRVMGGGGGFVAEGGGGGNYSYDLVNDTASGADYVAHEAFIPVPSIVSVSNLIVSSPSWSITRTTLGVEVNALSTGGGLLPGETLTFSFDADQPPISVLPSSRWRIPSLGVGGGGGGSDDPDDGPDMVPAFDPNDFGVLDGTYTYRLIADSWQTVPYDLVSAPMPEPASLAFIAMGFFALQPRRRGRQRSSALSRKATAAN